MNTEPAQVTRALKSYGNSYIEDVYVCKRELPNVLEKAVRATTKEMPAGKLYHAFILLRVKQGNSQQWLMLNKEEVVELKKVTNEEAEKMLKLSMKVEIGARRTIRTVKAFVGEAALYCKRRGLTYWRYNPTEANCQQFCLWNLWANGAKNMKEVEAFTLQQNMISSVNKWVSKAAEKTTDLAAIARRLYDSVVPESSSGAIRKLICEGYSPVDAARVNFIVSRLSDKQ